MARKPGGEFPKFSESVRKKYLERIAEGCGLYEAACSVGVSDGLVKQYRAAHREEWTALVEEAREKSHDRVENALFQSALKGNVTAQQVWLYNQRPEKWKDRRKPDVPLPAQASLDDLTVEELEAYHAICESAAARARASLNGHSPQTNGFLSRQSNGVCEGSAEG